MGTRRSAEGPTLVRPPRGLTEIGDWRLQELRSVGAYGSVFRAEPLHDPGAGPFALKLAVHPLDARFMREAALLRRVPPPHAPRLYDFGLWGHAAGPFPFLVMEWIEGVPLYAWAHVQPLSSRQLLRILAQVARALAAVHSVQAVHRDIKGDNILVRTEDSHPKLLDFGAGDFQGAPTLTREVLPPGTPGYRSPEALRFHWRYWSTPGALYAPGPADDPWLGAVAGMAVTAGLAVALVLHSSRNSESQAHMWPPENAALPVQEDSADAGVSLAKEAQRMSARVEQSQPTWEGLSAEKVKKPLPGQARPPCKQRGSVEINGGCWWLPAELPPCGEGEYEWGGRCYRPILASAPPSTSEQ